MHQVFDRPAVWVLGLTLAICATTATTATATTLDTLGGAAPIIVAHRGASGYLPEHTLAGYELAIKMGTDYIEPDLQLTKDGYLVAMHDTTLNRTTNVETVLGTRNGGYLVSNYTLSEIKQLTVEPTGTGKTSYAGFTPSYPDAFKVPTFDEVIQLAQAQSALVGRTVGIYPEAKIADPLMEDKILSTLTTYGYGNSSDKVIIQSFSLDTLKSIRVKQDALGLTMREVFLGNSAVSSFTDIAKYVDGIGPSITGGGANAVTDAYIDAAHAADLFVHGYTFADPNPLTADAQYDKYFTWGMDGVFSNYADIAVASRNDFVAASVPEPATYAMLLAGFGIVGVGMRRRASR